MNNFDSFFSYGSLFGLTEISCVYGSNSAPDFIFSAQIILDGMSLDGISNDGATELSISEYFSVMVHELGHLLGLDHTSANQILDLAINSGELDEDDYAEYIPTMEGSIFIHEDLATLNPNDIAAIQALYPFEDSPTSTLTGTVTNSNGNNFRGVQLELRSFEDPLCKVYSFISGKQCTPLIPDGGELPKMTGQDCGTSANPSFNAGDFLLRAIPPGDYALNVQEVTDAYKEDVIKPFDQFNPLPELFGEAEFYNTNDTASEDPLSMSEITVIDGINLDGLNMMLSSNTADGDGVENLLDLSLFSQSPFTDSLTVTATSRCQPNTVDYAALIGVEEIVGTTEGDDDGEDDTGGNNNDGEDDTEDSDSTTAWGCTLVAW